MPEKILLVILFWLSQLEIWYFHFKIFLKPPYFLSYNFFHFISFNLEDFNLLTVSEV